MKAKNLIPNRQIQLTIENIIESAVVDKETTKGWKEKKKEADLVKAQKLYDEGSVMDAAKLGLPVAQGEIANWYYNGTNGVGKDHDKCVLSLPQRQQKEITN